MSDVKINPVSLDTDLSKDEQDKLHEVREGGSSPLPAPTSIMMSLEEGERRLG